MERAYTILSTKSYQEDDEKVYVKGIASTPTTDRYGDTVDPMGAKFATPMPLLWQHDHRQPVGTMTLASPSKKGINFEAELPIIKEAGRLKERVDEAIQSMKYGLVNAVSIGFQIMEDGYELLENGGLAIKKWEWLELSLVTIPANSEAVISAVKSADTKALAAIGRKVEHQRKIGNVSGGSERKIRKPVMLIPRSNA
jgi:HK97 family phage prohead protease